MKPNLLTKKLSIFVIICGLLAGCIVIIGQYFYYGTYKVMDISDAKVLEEDEYKYFLESLDTEATVGDYYQIKGWGVIINKPVAQYNTKLVLYVKDFTNAKVFNTKMQTRSDVTQMMNDNNNYDASGFAVNIDSERIQGDNYNMALLIEIDEKLYLLPMEEMLVTRGD